MRVRGLVQDVSYRWSTRAEAVRLGVDGWVRNEDDGSVSAELEGERAAVEALVTWCREGPPAARVESVDVEWAAPTGERGFRIRH